MLKPRDTPRLGAPVAAGRRADILAFPEWATERPAEWQRLAAFVAGAGAMFQA